MDDICGQLDKTTLNIFKVLEDLYSKQDQLEQVMSAGFLGISRTRYSLGVKRISADQILDAELTANYTTKINNSVSSDQCTSLDEAVKLLKGNENDDVKLFELCDEFADMTVETKEDSDKKSPPSKDTLESKGLRKRNVLGADKEEMGKENPEKAKGLDEVQDLDASSSENSVNSEKEKKRAAPKRRKPISLFGVLVPQTLQSSQKCFEEAVQIAVNIADLKCRLNILQKEYKRLRALKNTLKGEEVSA